MVQVLHRVIHFHLSLRMLGLFLPPLTRRIRTEQLLALAIPDGKLRDTLAGIAHMYPRKSSVRQSMAIACP